MDRTDRTGLPDLPRRIRASLDAAVHALGGRVMIITHPELQEVQEFLEEEGRLTDVICDARNWQHVVGPEELASYIERRYDLEEEPPTAAEIRDLLQDALGGDTSFWGDEYPANVAVPVPTASAPDAVMGCRFTSWANQRPYEWQGLFASLASYLDWLARDGSFVHIGDFDALSPELGSAAGIVGDLDSVRHHLRSMRRARRATP